jgi:hypothetical protein
MATVDENNGFDAQAVGLIEQSLHIELSLEEAGALRAWLLKPAADGTTALDDSLVNSALKKLSGALDKIEAVAEIRRELEEAGLPTEGMDDDSVAELGRRIGQASNRALR